MKSMKYYIFSMVALFCCCLPSENLQAKVKPRVVSDKEPLFEAPVSQMATENQFYSPKFQFWCDELHENLNLHRKLWEFCYVCEVLEQNQMLQPGKKGLGFGVGTEPLTSLFAKYGVQVLATDQDFNQAQQQGWVASNQHANEKSNLNARGICDPQQFDTLVSLRAVDMNHIPQDLNGGFDFVWSCCSLEHLGSIKNGLDFIKNSVKCLKKGGIAVHTTEYNLSSYKDTVTSGPTVIFRRGDIFKVAAELIKQGYEVRDLNFHRGNGPVDDFIDFPPYAQDPHIKLRLYQYDCTSIGLIIRRP